MSRQYQFLSAQQETLPHTMNARWDSIKYMGRNYALSEKGQLHMRISNAHVELDPKVPLWPSFASKYKSFPRKQDTKKLA